MCLSVIIYKSDCDLQCKELKTIESQFRKKKNLKFAMQIKYYLSQSTFLFYFTESKPEMLENDYFAAVDI